jgi:hypothetical protein
MSANHVNLTVGPSSPLGARRLFGFGSLQSGNMSRMDYSAPAGEKFVPSSLEIGNTARRGLFN